MHKYKITYTYKRFKEWYIDTDVIESRLDLDDISIGIFKYEIEKEVMTTIVILDIN